MFKFFFYCSKLRKKRTVSHIGCANYENINPGSIISAKEPVSILCPGIKNFITHLTIEIFFQEWQERGVGGWGVRLPRFWQIRKWRLHGLCGALHYYLPTQIFRPSAIPADFILRRVIPDFSGEVSQS